MKCPFMFLIFFLFRQSGVLSKSGNGIIWLGLRLSNWARAISDTSTPAPIMMYEVRQPWLVISMLAIRGMKNWPAPVPILTMPVIIPLFLMNHRAVVLKAITSTELKPMPIMMP